MNPERNLSYGYDQTDIFFLVAIVALTVGLIMLILRQSATPIPVSESYVSSMDRRIAVLENMVDELRGMIAEKDVKISEQTATIYWYKNHYGEISMANNEMTIQQLLSQNKTHEALQKALDKFQGSSLDTVILLQGKYVRAKTYKAKGLQSKEEHERTLAGIGNALLELCKE